MSADGTIDKLVIKVSSDADAAAASLEKVAGALSLMERSTKGGMGGLKQAAASVTAIKTSLQGGGFAKLSTLASGLSQVNAAAQGLSGSYSGLAALASAIERFQGVKSTGFKGAASALSQIAAAGEGLKSVDDSAVAKIGKLSTAVSALGSIKGTGAKSAAAALNEVASMSSKLKAMDATSIARIRQLSTALSGFGEVRAGSLGTVIKRLQELPAVVRQYQGLSFKQFEAQVKTLASSLNSLATAVGRLGGAYSTLPRSMKSVSSATRSVVTANTRLEKAALSAQSAVSTGASSMATGTKEATTFTGKLKALGQPLQSIRSLWQGFKFSLFDLIGGALSSTVGAASDYVEDMNLTRTVLGSAFDSEREFWEKASNAYSIDYAEALKYQGTIQEMVTGMGIGTEAATTMSRTLTQLGYDLSSFENIDMATAMEKIQSGVSGNSLEPMRAIGYDLSDARIGEDREEIAAATGIDKSTSEMTQAEKVAARYYEMISQITEAHGDLGRTLTSPANQLRILQSQFQTLARNVGGLLLPALSAVTPVLIAIVKEAEKAVAAIGELFGVAGLDSYFASLDDVDYSSMSDGLSDAADEAETATDKVKEFKRQLLGFDQINNITDSDSDSSSSASGDSSGGLSSLKVPTYEWKFDTNLDDVLKDLRGIWNLASSIAFAVKGWQIAVKFVDRVKEALAAVRALASASKAAGLKTVSLKKVNAAGYGAKATKATKATKASKVIKFPGTAEKATETVSGERKVVKLSEAASKATPAAETGAKGGALAKMSGIVEKVAAKAKGLTVFSKVSGWASKAAAAFGTVLKYVKPIAELFKFPALGAALKTVGKFVPVLGEVLMAVDLVKGAFAVIQNAVGKLKDTGVFEKIQSCFEQIKTAIDDAFGGEGAFDDFVSQLTDLGGNVLVALITGFSKLLEFVTPAITALIPIIKQVVDFIGNIVLALGSLLSLDFEGVGQHLSGAFGAAWGVVESLFGGIGQWFLDRGNDIVNAMSGSLSTVGGLFSGVWATICDAFGGIKDFFVDKAQAVVSAFSSIPGKVGGFFSTAFSNAVNAIASLPAWVKEHIVDGVIGKFTDFGKKVGDTVGGAIKTAINGAIQTIENTINNIIGVIKKLPVVGEALNGFSVTLPRLATGGTVDRGQMFVAREAGPELVGQVGNKTGVMNNSQIVDAVASGVAQAVAQVMGAQGSSSKEVSLTVNLDGRQIIKSINGAQRRAGKVLLEV